MMASTQKAQQKWEELQTEPKLKSNIVLDLLKWGIYRGGNDDDIFVFCPDKMIFKKDDVCWNARFVGRAELITFEYLLLFSGMPSKQRDVYL